VHILKIENPGSYASQLGCKTTTRGCGVGLDTYIVKVFCLVDDVMKILYQERKFRERGSEPTLFDGDVMAIETVGEYLGLDQD
jgi:hypothetical protein